jgi:hypothetical protein
MKAIATAPLEGGRYRSEAQPAIDPEFAGADKLAAPATRNAVENGNYFLALAKFSSTCAQLTVFHQASR